MAEIKTETTMWATLKADCYGGDDCDTIVPVWNVYADGDKQDDDLSGAIELDPRHFAPGTRITVEEPVCPECGDTRFIDTITDPDNPHFPTHCDCGFDWDAWVRNTFG